MAGPYGVEDLTFSWGGTAYTSKLDMSSPINFKVAILPDEYRVMGGVWVKRDDSTQRMVDPIVLEFVYDPGGSPDLDDVFYDDGAKLGTKATAILGWGNSKTSTFSAIIMDYERIPSPDKQTRCKVTLGPDGAVTEA